jgi:hypothetical protein
MPDIWDEVLLLFVRDAAPDIWDEALLLLAGGDVRQLAQLIGGTSPIPARVRQRLGHMLDPDADPNTTDRLVLSRSPALARKIQTNQHRIMVGLAVVDATDAGTPEKRAIAEVARKFHKSASYVEKCVGLARGIPTAQREFARRNPPVWGTARK